MSNMQDLVGTLIQGVLADSSQGRIEHALGGRGLSRPGGVFEQILGGTTSGTGTGGFLSGLAEMAKSMFGSAEQGVRSGNPLAIGGLGALAGALLGGGGSATKGAVGGGAMALLGSLALEALRGLSQPSTGDASAAIPPIFRWIRSPANTARKARWSPRLW